uniref:Uncharacterized protein n=1 Tax=Triticum urartu TaxID=4572 RepID=A0A8R7VCP5_TRIUA
MAASMICMFCCKFISGKKMLVVTSYYSFRKLNMQVHICKKKIASSTASTVSFRKPRCLVHMIMGSARCSTYWHTKASLDSCYSWMMPLWSDLELWTPSLKLETCSLCLDFVMC